MLLLPAEFSSAKFIALFFNVLKLSGSGIWTAILIRYFDHPGGNVNQNVVLRSVAKIKSQDLEKTE